MPTLKQIFYALLFLFTINICLASAGQDQDDSHFVAIIIDDLGGNFANGVTAIYTPGDITVSILPHKKYSQELASLSHQEQKEVMLHMPMQPIDSQKVMGPGGLRFDMTRSEVEETFLSSFASVPHAVGVNNHMGSLLTAQSIHMNWLMQTIKQTGDLYFVDSRTHHATIANFIAGENNLLHTSRDIFLDHYIEVDVIEQQFRKLIRRALNYGYALAIGHPHHETFHVLNKWIPRLKEFGIKLVPVSKYINLQQQREKLWHASLSRSLKGVKN